MPHLVDPQLSDARHIFCSFRIETALFEPGAENRVAEADLGADTAIEGIVGVGNVVMPPCKLPRIERHHAASISKTAISRSRTLYLTKHQSRLPTLASGDFPPAPRRAVCTAADQST